MSLVPVNWNTHVTWRMAFPHVCVCDRYAERICGEMREG